MVYQGRKQAYTDAWNVVAQKAETRPPNCRSQALVVKLCPNSGRSLARQGEV